MLTRERMIVREGAQYWWVFLVSGIVWLLIAWLVLRLNERSITTVGVLIGVVFLLAGTFEIVQGVASRSVNPYWWVNLITGILLVLLAFWVSGSDRVYALAQKRFLILFWVGFFALFRGFTQIMLAFGVRHAETEAAAADAAGPR